MYSGSLQPTAQSSQRPSTGNFALAGSQLEVVSHLLRRTNRAGLKLITADQPMVGGMDAYEHAVDELARIFRQ
jgi:hypothetical protein